MLDIVVATNDQKILEGNLLRSPLVDAADVTLHLQSGHASAGRAYNEAIALCRHDLIVFAHQDVYVPHGWEETLFKETALLQQEDSTWGVLGVYGVTASGSHVGYVWSSGLNTLLGKPFARPEAVASVDELLIVLRRSSGLLFDEALPGFHLYGTDIVQTALSRGCGAYVICAPVVHNSRPVLYLPDDYLRAYEYEVRKWRTRLPIPNCVAPLVASRGARWKMRAKQLVARLRNVHRQRANLDRGFDCVQIARRFHLEAS